MDKPKFKLLISTAPDQTTAESLAKQLVENKLAACVNLVPKITSIYQWQDHIEQSDEVMLFIKTTTKNFIVIEEFIQKQHPYEVPELISLDITQISDPYLQWLTSSLN